MTSINCFQLAAINTERLMTRSLFRFF